MERFADERLKFKKTSLLLLGQGEWLLQIGGLLTSWIGDWLLRAEQTKGTHAAYSVHAACQWIYKCAMHAQWTGEFLSACPPHWTRDCLLHAQWTGDCMLHAQRTGECLLHAQWTGYCLLHAQLTGDCLLHGRWTEEYLLHAQWTGECLLHAIEQEVAWCMPIEQESAYTACPVTNVGSATWPVNRRMSIACQWTRDC